MAVSVSRSVVIHTTNSAFLVLVELSFDKPQHKARLSNSRLTKQNQLELAHLCLTTTWSLICGRRGHDDLNLDWFSNFDCAHTHTQTHAHAHTHIQLIQYRNSSSSSVEVVV